MKRILLLAMLLVSLALAVHAQVVDSLFSNSLQYNSLYETDEVIDSSYVADLVQRIETSQGAEKVGLLHKLLNGYYFSNPQLTRDLAVKALDEARTLDNDSLLAFSLHYLGIAYIYLEQHRLSIDTYTKALATPYAAGHSDYRSWCSMNMANSCSDLGRIDEAAALYYQAIKLNEAIGNLALAGKIYDNLGSLYLSAGNLDEAQRHLNQSLDYLDKENDRRVTAGVLSKLAVVATRKHQHNAATSWFNQVLSQVSALNDSSLAIEVYTEYADALFEEGRHSTALAQYQRGRGYCDRQRYPVGYYTFLHGMGRCHLYLGSISLAAQYLTEAARGLEAAHVTVRKYEVQRSLSKLYARTGDWQRFNQHLKLAETYKAAELEAKELATVNELKILHETEKKDRLLAENRQRIAHQRRQILLTALVAVLLLAGFIITLVLRFRLKKANRELFEKNRDITRRWNQLQHFYQLQEQAPQQTPSLFMRINRAMHDDRLFTRHDLSIELMARQVESNVKYVSQTVNEHAGMNFSAYVNTFRIEAAKASLTHEESRNWSIEAIAQACGFNNPTSFYQAFKKNTGMTPAAYKNATAAAG